MADAIFSLAQDCAIHFAVGALAVHGKEKGSALETINYEAKPTSCLFSIQAPWLC
jgi:hypothetical protein